MFALRTLGGLRLTGAGGELLSGRQRDLALLVYIARHRPRALARAELAALLWGERTEAAARHSLRQVLLRLRRTLGGCLEVHADRVCLAEGTLQLDVMAFEADVAAGRLHEAVARWDGEFLLRAEDVGGETYRAWVEGEREQLRQRFAGACEQLVVDAQRGRDWPQAVSFAERWTEAMPLDEHACRRLIETFRLAGRAADAGARHAAFVARLRRELEVEPSPAFVQLGRELAERAHTERRARPSPGSAALFTPDLVGRSAAFGQLTTAWTAARAVQACVVFVEGDEGIGKTRLCEEFLRSAAEGSERTWVLRARARETERDAPWSTARELLAGLTDAPGLAAAPPGALAALGQLVPGIRERFPPRAEAASWPLEDAIMRVLADVAAEVPVIVFLDDAPLADAATLASLGVLATRLRQRRVLALLSARSDELVSIPALRDLRNAYGVERVHLYPLPVADIESLLASMLELGPAERHELAACLHAEGGGNPFCAMEVTAALVDEGHVVPDAAGVWRLASPLGSRALPIPTSVRDAVARRLAVLSDGGRRLAEAAAVLAAPADRELLEAVVGLADAEFEAALAELVARRVLRETAARPRAYTCAHELARRATYESMTPVKRRSLHRLAVSALTVRARTDEAAHSALRYHHARAGSASQRLVDSVRARPVRVALGAALAAVALLAGGKLWRERLGKGLAPPNSVAVLYFDNLARDTADAYLADGLTEELITRIGRVERLTVKSRGAVQRYRGVTADPAVLGPALGVTYLLSGSTRRSGPRIRVAVELVRTADGVRIWGDAYDRPTGDLLAIEDDIARAVATNVAGRLVPEDTARLATQATRSAGAYDHFLRGNFELAKRDPRAAIRAIGEYAAAMRLDPQFVQAYARMAIAYSQFPEWGWEFPGLEADSLVARGTAAARRALTLDSSSSDAWLADASLGSLRYPKTYEGVTASLQRAIALDPRNAEALHEYGTILQDLGEDSAAVAAFERALALEPDRAIELNELGVTRLLQRRPAQALRAADSALAVDHGLTQAYRVRARAFLQLGNVTAARADLNTVLAIGTGDYRDQALLTMVDARAGDTAGARVRLRRVMASLGRRFNLVQTGYLGGALTAVGDTDAALNLLERTSGITCRFLRMEWYEPLRTNPRFRRLVAKCPGRARP